jgi:TRAP-type C4-dicarboxylate transport system substrate-binding protein
MKQNMTTTLRKLLMTLACAGALFGTAARAETIELKLSHYVPPNHTIHKFLEAWAADLAQKSGGRLSVKIYPAAQLGPVQRQFDLARTGQADLAVGLTGATPGRYPMTELTSLPYIWPKDGSSSAITSRRATELAPKYLAKEFEGVHILWIGITPTISFFTARREIARIDDIRGLKLRFQGELNAKMLRLLDAIPLQVPPGDIADGMSKGVIDGALFNYEAAQSFGLGPVTHYVTGPGFLTGSLALVMNAARYDALPADLRALIDSTTGPEAAALLGKNWDEAEQRGRDYMAAAKVSMTPLAADQIDAVKAKLEPLRDTAVDDLEKAGKPARAFLDAYLQ